MSNDDRPIRIPIPPKLSLTPEPIDPTAPTLEYRWTTFGQYRDERNRNASREWYEKHKDADTIVVNQDGDILYALYVSPLGSHEEATDHLFKTLRAQRYLEGEL